MVLDVSPVAIFFLSVFSLKEDMLPLKQYFHFFTSCDLIVASFSFPNSGLKPAGSFLNIHACHLKGEEDLLLI